MSPVVECSSLSVVELGAWSELAAITADWERLLQENVALGLFSTPEWLESWWHAYGTDKELVALVFTDRDRQIVGMILMYRQLLRSLFGFRVSLLRLVGDGSTDSDDLDFIVRPGCEQAVVRAFLNWARDRRCDVCYLNCLSPRSIAARLLARELENHAWPHVTHQRPCAVVSLPDSWQLYLKQLSSKERGKIGNRTRKLQMRHRLRFCRCEGLEDLPKCLETLFDLHQEHWETRDRPGSFNLPERRQFYREMTSLLLARDRLELWFLELDGQTVAAQIALRYANTAYSLQEGFDPAYTRDSVGYVLRGHVLRKCIEAGVEKYDFLAGDEDSKRRWGAEISSYTDIHFARPGSPGVLHLRVAEAVWRTKRWLRTHLPSRAVKMLQSLRRA
jgi:CelD/BcsL family acetyltransferase involved in cellulose biosynthesis